MFGRYLFTRSKRPEQPTELAGSATAPLTAVLRVSFLVALLALTPKTLTPSDGIASNEACAGHSCAPEFGSVCSNGDMPLYDYYAYERR